jgi:hypothetical protein
MRPNTLIGEGLRNNGSSKPESRLQPPHDKAQDLGSENVEKIIKQRKSGDQRNDNRQPIEVVNTHDLRRSVQPPTTK